MSWEHFDIFTMNNVVNMREMLKKFGCIFIEGRISRIDRVISILRVLFLVRRHNDMGDGSIFLFGIGSHFQIGKSLTGPSGGF